MNLLPAEPHRAVTVFYDGGCALCSKEIAHYVRLDRVRQRMRWIDITRNEHRLTEHEYERGFSDWDRPNAELAGVDRPTPRLVVA